MVHPLVQPRGHWMRDVISDEDVVSRVVGGEGELFELLVRRHNQRLFRVARSILADDGEAEEALQRAYVQAWRALDQFAGRASFLTWMTRITLRCAGRLARERRRRSVGEDAVFFPPPAMRQGSLGAHPEALPESERGELRRTLEQAIDRLPESYRTVFVLRAVEGLSTAEVARDLELSESAVKVRLMRAREKLRANLSSRAQELGVLADAWSFAGERCNRITEAVFARLRRLP